MSKHDEYSEHLYDDEHKLRIQAENKCANCPFVKHTKVSIVNKPTGQPDEKKEGES